MGLQKLGIVIGWVVLFAGAFAAVSCGPFGSDSAAKNDGVPVVDANFTGMAPATQPRKSQSDDVKDTGRNTKPAPAKAANKKPKAEPPVLATCADATKLGEACVGRRVTWYGQWTNSTSATVKGKKGAMHVFNTVGPDGDYSFAFPFIAEDTNPLQTVPRGQDVRAHFDAKWGPSRVVTVTGTIARVEKLIMIGQGTRDRVPVLADITITINY